MFWAEVPAGSQVGGPVPSSTYALDGHATFNIFTLSVVTTLSIMKTYSKIRRILQLEGLIIVIHILIKTLSMFYSLEIE